MNMVKRLLLQVVILDFGTDNLFLSLQAILEMLILDRSRNTEIVA